MNFDVQRLRQAMEAGNILPNAADMAALDRSLQVIQQRHLVRLTEKERDHTALIERARKIRDAAATILSAVETDRPDSMGEIETAFDLFELSKPRDLESVRVLRNRAEQLLRLEEREYSIQSKHSRIKVSTELSLDLLDLLRQFDKKVGITPNGPLYRFSKMCAALIDAKLEFPDGETFRGCLMQADKRRRKPPTYYRPS